MAKLIDSLRPSLFVSYSRRQGELARLLKAGLTKISDPVWFDEDEISNGDRWRSEIEVGIDRADEVVLLVSRASLASPVVHDEVSYAVDRQRAVHPFIIEPLQGELPEWMNRFHYNDVSRQSSSSQVSTILQVLGGTPEHAISSTALLKLAAARQLVPAFPLSAIRGVVPDSAAAVANQLHDIGMRRAPASPVLLNAGLAACLSGHWARGIEALDRYAVASNTLAGWHMLSIHAFARAAPSSVSVALRDRAYEAAQRAARLGENPLVALQLLALEGGAGCRPGFSTQVARFQQFQAARAVEEDPREYLRWYWAMSKSVDRLDSRISCEVQHFVRSQYDGVS